MEGDCHHSPPAEGVWLATSNGAYASKLISALLAGVLNYPEPWPGGTVGWSDAPKGCGFNPLSGHIPRLWV